MHVIHNAPNNLAIHYNKVATLQKQVHNLIMQLCKCMHDTAGLFHLPFLHNQKSPKWENNTCY